jgi:Acetoacetate decarboxylase (ADC)
MNPYVDLPGEQSLRPPGEFQGTRFFYFVLEGDKDRLRSVCDRYLNGPSGGKLEYSPLGVVLLAFSHVERLSSADPERGTIAYKDIAFWVPVWGGKTRSLCLFPPFIFVDNAATMATGREVFGLPKQLGRFEMPVRFQDLATAPRPQFRAEVVGTLQPGGRNDWRTLLTVEQIAREETSDTKAFFTALGRMLLPSALKQFAVPAWLSHLAAVPTVGLKQFRDAAQPKDACYQAIVEAPLSTVALHGSPRFFFNAFELNLMDVVSHPVTSLLGLPLGPQVIPLTVYFEATMRMDAGTVVWSAE